MLALSSLAEAGQTELSMPILFQLQQLQAEGTTDSNPAPFTLKCSSAKSYCLLRPAG